MIRIGLFFVIAPVPVSILKRLKAKVSLSRRDSFQFIDLSWGQGLELE